MLVLVLCCQLICAPQITPMGMIPAIEVQALVPAICRQLGCATKKVGQMTLERQILDMQKKIISIQANVGDKEQYTLLLEA